MSLLSGVSVLRARALLVAVGATGWIVMGSCRSDDVNQPQAPSSPQVPISATSAPLDGLIGEWKLDEMGGTTAADTKSGYTDTLHGGAGFVPGKLGRALNLNNGTAGTGGKYAEMPSNPSLDDVQEGNYTLSAWFYPYTVPPDTSSGTGTEDRRWAIVAKAGFHMGLMYEHNQSFSIRHYLTGNVLKNPQSATAYPPNTWYHVAGVVNKAAGKVTIYVNGASAGTTTFDSNTAARDYQSARFRIGKGSSNWAADGKVDQVRIYNRALSAAEISDLYNETTGGGGGTSLSNCIGADSLGDRTTYSDRRVFLESQSWWGKRKADGSFEKHGAAEHLHVAMCFPLNDTVSGNVTMIVRVLGHNLPIGSLVKSTSLHDPNNDTTHISLVSIPWNHVITQADHDDPNGYVAWDTVTINTALMPNGIREFRNLTIVKRKPEPLAPDSAEIHASSGWCWTTLNPGRPTANSGSCDYQPEYATARGWYDCFEYKITETRDWDPYATHNTAFSLTIGARDGSGPNSDFTSWEVRLDPKFHMNDPGQQIAAGTGAALGVPVTIQAQNLTPGIHRLAIIGSANNHNCTGGAGVSPQDGEVSGVFLIPINVN